MLRQASSIPTINGNGNTTHNLPGSPDSKLPQLAVGPISLSKPKPTTARIRDVRGISPMTKLALFCLESRGINVHPSLKTLAADMGVSRDTARRAVRELRTQALIHVEKRQQAHKGPAPNAYRVTVPDQGVGAWMHPGVGAPVHPEVRKIKKSKIPTTVHGSVPVRGTEYPRGSGGAGADLSERAVSDAVRSFEQEKYWQGLTCAQQVQAASPDYWRAARARVDRILASTAGGTRSDL